MTRETGEFRQMVRAAQSVMHRSVQDRRIADWMGYGIADFVACNWGTVSHDFGHGAQDEMEVVERVAYVVLRELPKYQQAAA
jgi:hypothetical protein